MAYHIEFTPDGLASIEQLPKNIQRRIRNKLEEYATNASPFSKAKVIHTEGDIRIHSLRIGDYRVLHSFDDNILYIYVIHAGHRKNVYRDL